MPAKNSLKDYASDSYYHVYNRGVAKQDIFLDEQDYKTFLSYLKLYLTPVNLQGQSLKIPPSRQLKNYSQELKLLAYCLMPNHFHLFVFQKEDDSMADFLRSLGTKYSMYFNKKFKRVGHVFQGRYKAVMITNENQFIYLSKYIHRNPLPLPAIARTVLAGYKYSSYQNYLGKFYQSWVNKEKILSYFSKLNPEESYQKFVEETDERDLLMIKDSMLDFDE
ncbi:MAG: transposase [Patescibacteria group bacterium]|nr:transposase [Candidatus Beckwithbacteria bacterium]MDZ4229148.1 transposase [Patescibacteria group bacterium]